MSMFAAGVAKALADKQDSDQKSQALGIQAASVMGQQDLARQQLNAQIQRWTGEDAKTHLDNFQKLIEQTGTEAAAAVKAGKGTAAVGKARQVISDYITQNAPAIQLWSKAAGVQLPDPLAMFDARVGLAPTPGETGTAAGVQSVAQAGAENNGGLPVLQGQAEGIKAIAAQPGKTTAEISNINATSPAKANAAAASSAAVANAAPAILPPEKRAILESLKARGVPEKTAFDIASGLLEIKPDPVGGGFFIVDKAGQIVSAAGNGTPKLTENESRAYTYATRMGSAEKILGDVDKAGMDFVSKAGGSVPLVGNFLVPEDYQRFRAAAENWMTANLRLESGAQIGEQEFDRDFKKYFPQPGDTAQTIKDKQAARLDAQTGMIRAAGKAFSNQAPAPNAPSVKASADTKIIGSDTYKNINGTWFKVE